MSEPVTAAELAEALQDLRLAVTTCVLTADWPMPEFRGPLESARSLLARYDAQQAEASKPERDESRDVWLPKFVLGESLRTKEPRTGRILPNANEEYSSIASGASKPALSEVERAALNLLTAHSWQYDEALSVLEESLKKRGAL